MNATIIVLLVTIVAVVLAYLFLVYGLDFIKKMKLKKEMNLKKEKEYSVEIQQKEKLDQVNMYTIVLVLPIEFINQHGIDSLTDTVNRDMRKMITSFGYKTFEYPTFEQMRVIKAKGEIIDFDFLITPEMQIYSSKEEYFKNLYHTIVEENIMGMMLYYHNCFKADLTDLKK